MLPYRNLIGGELLDMIMVGHLIAPEFSDPENTPASLSRRAIDEGLRKRLGFDGLVITDDLNMAAIRKRYSTEQAAVMAVARAPTCSSSGTRGGRTRWPPIASSMQSQRR